jgi:hypothetical protein
MSLTGESGGQAGAAMAIALELGMPCRGLVRQVAKG